MTAPAVTPLPVATAAPAHVMRGPQTKETKLWVSRTAPRDPNSPLNEHTEEALEITLFETAPAQVTTQMGMTINLGNYESLRIDVGVTLPCYREETADALTTATDLVQGRLMAERAEVDAMLGRTKGKP